MFLSSSAFLLIEGRRGRKGKGKGRGEKGEGRGKEGEGRGRKGEL